MSRRAVPILGLAAAGGVGYYLYNAGGDPKVAQKHAEADLHKASAKVQNELPGRKEQVEARGEAYARQAENKVDSAAKDAKQKYNEASRDAKQKYNEASAEAKAKFEESKREASNLASKAGTEINKGIDKFDATVTDGAAKAKSGISSWFGGK